VDIPTPTAPGAPYGVIATKDRDIYAAVDTMGGLPVVVGFLFPEVCQMLFLEAQLKIQRHASDVYTMVDAEGNAEFFHPSGTYLRIGASPAHRDLTGQDFDKKWKIANNTSTPVHVHLSVRNAGAEVGSVDMDPSGNMVTAAASWSHTGPVTFHSPVTFDAQVNVTSANIEVTGGDVVADGISLKTHPHSGVQAGGSDSGPPVPS
jgi:hypothetical protein